MKMACTGLVASVLLVACGDGTTDTETAMPAESSASAERIFDFPYLMRDLDNGLRVIVVPTDFPDIVTLQIPVQTGSRNEVEPGKSGFAHFFEHMMFRGTEKYPADVYHDVLKKAGATQNAYTSDDLTNYYTTFTRDDLEKMIEIEADRFRNLSYSQDAFRTEALAVKGEYLKNFSDPTSKAYERLREMAFERHPYRHTTMGFLEDIEAMPGQFDFSREFFDRWYRPEKTTVILVGDVDPEAAFALVKKYWGGWQRGDHDAAIPEEPPLAGPLYDHIEWDGTTQPWLFIGFRGPAFSASGRDMPAIDVISSLYFSDSSPLYRELVLEKQSVDQLRTYFPNRKDPNVLLIYARLTDSGHAADVEAAIAATLAAARSEPVSAERLAEAKSRLRYAFASRLDSAGAIGSMLAGYVHFERTPETVNELYRSYAALAPEDLLAVANRYFVDGGRVTVSLSSGPEMSGVDGQRSIDALVTAAPTIPQAAAGEPSRETPAPRGPEMTAAPAPVSVPLVAQPSGRSALVDVVFLFAAGAAMDPPGKRGLAALTAAMIADGGSEALSIEEINAALYPLAAGFDARVDKEMTRFAGQVHRDNLERWYALVSGQLLSPGWRHEDLRRVRTRLVNAVRTNLVANNDEELGKELLYRRIYGPEHPYGAPNLGLSGDLGRLTLADVREFFSRHYTVHNVTLGLAGGYPPEFAARVERDLQQLPRGEAAAPLVPAPAAPAANEAVIVAKETPAVAVSFGFPIALKRGDPDWVALWLVRSWLGEHRTSMGRLFRRLREARGLNYGDYAYIEYFPRGMFRSQPDTNLGRQQQIFQIWLRPLRDNNDAHFATRAAIHELGRLIESGLGAEEFENTRNFLAKYVSLQTDGQTRRLGYALDSRYYGIDEFPAYVRRELARLTPAVVNRVLRQQLRTERIHFVFVTRDAADLRRRLLGDLPSPVAYDAAQPEALLDEDRRIATLPLPFADEQVSLVRDEEVFE